MPQAVASTAAAVRAMSAPTNAPGRPRALRMASRSMSSVPQVRQLLGNLVSGWGVQRSGEASIGEQDHTVSLGCRYRIVGDHHHRVTVLVDYLPQQGEHLPPVASVERS